MPVRTAPTADVFLIAYGTNRQAKGEAEAFSINEKAKANAEVMKMKADAYKEYKGGVSHVHSILFQDFASWPASCCGAVLFIVSGLSTECHDSYAHQALPALQYHQMPP